MHSHSMPRKEEMRGRCFCMLVGGTGKKLGKELLHPIYYSCFPSNHLIATHRFTWNALNSLNLGNDALLKSQQGSQLSLANMKDLHWNNFFITSLWIINKGNILMQRRSTVTEAPSISFQKKKIPSDFFPPPHQNQQNRSTRPLSLRPPAPACYLPCTSTFCSYSSTWLLE